MVLFIEREGPSIGYFPQSSKSYLVVDKEHCLRPKEEFGCLGINVVDSQRLLSSVIGSDTGKKTFIEELMKKWIDKLECLTMIAATQPQAAFAAFTRSMGLHVCPTHCS